MQGSIKKLQEEISAFGAKKQELDETVSQQKEVRGRKGRERRETDERERESPPSRRVYSCMWQSCMCLLHIATSHCHSSTNPNEPLRPSNLRDLFPLVLPPSPSPIPPLLFSALLFSLPLLETRPGRALFRVAGRREGTLGRPHGRPQGRHRT